MLYEPTFRFSWMCSNCKTNFTLLINSIVTLPVLFESIVCSNGNLAIGYNLWKTFKFQHSLQQSKFVFKIWTSVFDLIIFLAIYLVNNLVLVNYLPAWYHSSGHNNPKSILCLIYKEEVDSKTIPLTRY